MTTRLSASDTEVSAELEAEINSIKAENPEGVASYKPQAWTREGRTD